MKDLKRWKDPILYDRLIQVDEITDIEINPLFISEKGAIAVDCRVRVE